MKCKLKFYFEVLGGHTHVSVFSAMEGQTTFGRCGELILRNEEFEALQRGAIQFECFDVTAEREKRKT